MTEKKEIKELSLEAPATVQAVAETESTVSGLAAAFVSRLFAG